MSIDTDARVLVALGFDFEADVAARPRQDGSVDYLNFHEHEFGGRKGIWRLLAVLEKYGVDATFFICSALLRTYPAACRKIQEGGYEIAAHTVHHEDLATMSFDQEDAMFQQMLVDFEEFYGERPVGFRTCYPSEHSLDFVAKYGFYYDTTTRDDERPYIMERSAGSYVEIPRGFNGDAPLVGTPVPSEIHSGKYNTGAAVSAAWRAEFDWLYREGARETKLMSLCVHPYISGRRSRVKALEEFLEHTLSHDEVRYVTHLDVARLHKGDLVTVPA